MVVDLNTRRSGRDDAFIDVNGRLQLQSVEQPSYTASCDNADHFWSKEPSGLLTMGYVVSLGCTVTSRIVKLGGSLNALIFLCAISYSKSFKAWRRPPDYGHH